MQESDFNDLKKEIKDELKSMKDEVRKVSDNMIKLEVRFESSLEANSVWREKDEQYHKEFIKHVEQYLKDRQIDQQRIHDNTKFREAGMKHFWTVVTVVIGAFSAILGFIMKHIFYK